MKDVDLIAHLRAQGDTESIARADYLEYLRDVKVHLDRLPYFCTDCSNRFANQVKNGTHKTVFKPRDILEEP